MASYAGARRPQNPDPIQAMLFRPASPSDTLALSDNYRQEGIYILHGDQDDNVPVGQARTMVKHLAAYHRGVRLHEQTAQAWPTGTLSSWSPCRM